MFEQLYLVGQRERQPVMYLLDIISVCYSKLVSNNIHDP